MAPALRCCPRHRVQASAAANDALDLCLAVAAEADAAEAAAGVAASVASAADVADGDAADVDVDWCWVRWDRWRCLAADRPWSEWAAGVDNSI